MRVLILFLIVLLIEVYYTKKLKKSIAILFPNFSTKRIKIIFRYLLVVTHIYPVLVIGYRVYISLSGDITFTPPQSQFFDFLIVYPFWFWIVLVIQSAVLLIPIDIVKLITYPFWKKWKELINKWNAKIVAGLVIILVVYVPFRIIYDHNSVDIRQTEYKNSALPQSLNNFKIILISDLQADWYTNENRLSKFIDKVNETNPDLVLVAGDIITTSPLYINLGAEYLGKIRSVNGVYSCVGDHDNWAYRFSYQRSLNEVKQALSDNNIPMLDNENKVIRIDSVKIGISFITENYVNRIKESKLNELTSEFPKCDLKILLTHQPRQKLISKAIEKKYNLLLAGHTHGGQITFFFPFFNLSPTLIETNYVKGDFWFGDLLLVVTRGLGMSLAPIRFNSTPEVTVINLISEL